MSSWTGELKTQLTRCEILKLLLNRPRLLADRKLLGQWGEKRCEKFLKRKGLKTLTRNFTCKTGEIDLIMVDADRTLVFVEVKTRADESFSPSESAITSTKKTKMIRTARYFLASNEIEDRPLRFDVVTIILGRKGPAQIKHYKNTFVPQKRWN
ncbi:MAG: YraN family protein [Phycisphaerales bacterium]|nr:MAG: YraN family protein [Phycisphaerales bacterium]